MNLSDSCGEVKAFGHFHYPEYYDLDKLARRIKRASRYQRYNSNGDRAGKGRGGCALERVCRSTGIFSKKNGDIGGILVSIECHRSIGWHEWCESEDESRHSMMTIAEIGLLKSRPIISLVSKYNYSESLEDSVVHSEMGILRANLVNDLVENYDNLIERMRR